MDRNTKSFIDLPSDVLLQTFCECNVLDILAISSTCKQLQLIADEHQVWLNQVGRLQIPIPPGTTPSKTELKDWVISRTRVDVCWIKRHPADLVVHLFETNADFMDAHLVPGGEFVVFLFANGDLVLDRIEGSGDTGDLFLEEVARYEEPDEAIYPGSWSRLLTETSYGCPVLVWAGGFDWENPYVFLIDPVSQSIEKKQYLHCGFDDASYFNMRKITAMKDDTFFICEAMEPGVWITVVAGLDQDQVIRQLHLKLPPDDNTSDSRFFLVSENGLIATNPSGIHLYHLPELEISYGITPTWSWLSPSRDPVGYRGTFYETGPPYPALWLQGEQTTHTLEFDVDESGHFPVVANHHITEGKPAYYTAHHLKLKGRKVAGVDVNEHGKAVFKTGVLGRPDLTRQLRASLPGLFNAHWRVRDELKYVDLDEATGRIMIVIGTHPGRRSDSIPYARQLCLADLPN